MEKQKWSFRTLKWSQWSPKKRYEQLRSSSIHWRCQMVRTGTRKTKKWSVCFWILGVKCRRVIVDGWFCDVFVSAGALKVTISVPQVNFCSNFDQKHFFWIFIVLFFVFFSTSIFWFYWHLRILLKKYFFGDDFFCFCSILLQKSSPSPIYNLLG